MLLLKRGGETIYNGPLGFQSADMISYFEAIPGRSSAIKGHTVCHSSQHLDFCCSLPDPLYSPGRSSLQLILPGLYSGMSLKR